MTNMESFMAVNETEKELLGKFLYFSLANVLIEKEEMQRICTALGFPYTGRRISEIDAFHNATGSIAAREVVTADGAQHIIKVYCRDNRRKAGVYSRELVRETIGHDTNQYEKLANLCYDKINDLFFVENVVTDDRFVDVPAYCARVEGLFHTFRHCLGRSQVDTIAQHFLGSLDALPVSVHGKFFFVPRYAMHKADLFEDFIEALNLANQHEKPLVVNSLFVADDAKQREKMTAEFYALVHREAQEYQERAEKLIANGCQSPAILERVVVRIQELKRKKDRFEALLRDELEAVQEDFATLGLFSQELQLRAQNLRSAA